jgi:hypothetical protein
VWRLPPVTSPELSGAKDYFLRNIRKTFK